MTTTLAPQRREAERVARPNPPPAPVTMATRPSKLPLMKGPEAAETCYSIPRGAWGSRIARQRRGERDLKARAEADLTPAARRLVSSSPARITAAAQTMPPKENAKAATSIAVPRNGTSEFHKSVRRLATSKASVSRGANDADRHAAEPVGDHQPDQPIHAPPTALCVGKAGAEGVHRQNLLDGATKGESLELITYPSDSPHCPEGAAPQHGGLKRQPSPSFPNLSPNIPKKAAIFAKFLQNFLWPFCRIPKACAQGSLETPVSNFSKFSGRRRPELGGRGGGQASIYRTFPKIRASSTLSDRRPHPPPRPEAPRRGLEGRSSSRRRRRHPGRLTPARASSPASRAPTTQRSRRAYRLPSLRATTP